MLHSTAPSLIHMRSLRLMHVPLAWLLSLSVATAQPYIPTRVLQNDTLLYVFQPSQGASSQFELGTIDSSAKFTASGLPYNILSPSLPFLDSDTHHAFTPVLGSDGNITVYTGDCTLGVGGSELWVFSPESSGPDRDGSWHKEGISGEVDRKYASAVGPNYLSSGMAFSSLVDGKAADTGLYFFGGMCPTQGEGDEWQASANYTNLMVTFEASGANNNALTYQLDISTSRGPPIPEAGFTLTGLLPTFSNKSDGTRTQQQNYVLVGGHTSAAFINMSQVALFSLPQQGWTFLPVLQPSAENTDLAVRRDAQDVEPRSGHSTTLTPDGRHLIVFGGWIGDLATPAEPQLAVLNVAEGYGGQGDWQWSVPSTLGAGPSSGAGVFGHGAAMLPGGILMVMGGYSIAAPSGRAKRAGPVQNTQTYFYNVSSSSWITDYSPPPKTSVSSMEDSGPLSKPSQKAGLGVGIGVGMAAILGLVVFYLWYTRRTKKQRDAREKQLQELAMGAHRYNLDAMSPGIDGRGGHAAAVDYFDDPNDSYFHPSQGQNQNQGWRRTKGHDAERTGLLVEIPSPTRGLRRSLSGRNNHHMARYDERRVQGSGNIHPIDEVEEEAEDRVTDQTPLNQNAEVARRADKPVASVFDNAPVLDPFTDNNRASGIDQKELVSRSAPTSPMHTDMQEIGHAQSDWHMAMAALLPRKPVQHSPGRVSPTRSDRTESNLSDRSDRSNLSSNSTRGSMARSVSVRSAAILNNASHGNPFKTPEASPTTDRAYRYSAGWQSPSDPRTRSLTSIRSNRPGTANADADSFTTARTSFMQLQAEGEMLLGGNPERNRPGTASTSNGSDPHSYQNTEPNMSRAGTVTTATSTTDGPMRQRRKSWLGSVRKALTRSQTAADHRTRSLTASIPDPYTDNPKYPSRSNSKTKSDPASKHQSFPPRRALSDASFWRSKRGQRDWLDEELDPSDPRARWRRNSGDDWGAPEDVEHAEKERQRREWRERALINLDDEALPSPHTPIYGRHLGVSERMDAGQARPRTPADEEDWDVEAAVERRVVQVMFTVPRSRLRVVNADIDGSSIMSLPQDESVKEDSNSPGRVRNMVNRFEREGTPRVSPSPRPSPSPSIKSMKLRNKNSQVSLAGRGKARSTSLNTNTTMGAEE